MNRIVITKPECVRYLKQIDFGDIDGLYDPNLEKYFLDEQFWENIVDRNIYYVIGRKGTGKSALYQWIYMNQSKNEAIVSNLSFQDFPFEKLLSLDDNDFSKPNQYQSIWKNIILNELCKIIISDQNNIYNDDYKLISCYLDFIYGKDLVDLHKQTTQKASKSGSSVVFKNTTFLHENECSATFSTACQNITTLNRMLEKIITDYLKISPSVKYVIQFDQLDDNFNKYTNNEMYFQCIISLFKIIYNMSQSFKRDNIPVKIIGYLRSDIFYAINQYDSESARWDQYKYVINWAIINRNDWHNSRLLHLINKRINASINIGKENSFPILFDKDILNIIEYGKVKSLFSFIIHRTFHRPRDLIQFCLKIQEQVKQDNTIGRDQIFNAEKEYSLWLLTEIENEIGAQISNTTILYEFLRDLGSSDYSITDFKTRYSRFEAELKLDSETLLHLLYRLGIVMNVSFNSSGERELFWVIRNDRSAFNRDLRILTHPGFYKGIYVSRFLKK